MMDVEKFRSTMKKKEEELSSDEFIELEMRRKLNDLERCALQQHEWNLKRHTRDTVMKCLSVLNQQHRKLGSLRNMDCKSAALVPPLL
ncbi:unnamed protein product [Thelazia callipaeda]|uniref:Coiled-coil domain-containing protein 167 n=1 Tax=Thelazia callipaeda TaxID=103827 RepID=A0A0N5DAT3_THECL|nr:unnamed protein product [Thelazia callipaeda]